MIKFFKPNPRVTGNGCSFSYNSKDQSFWINFVKQSSWENGKGKFQVGPDKKANAKFSATEIAGMVQAIDSNKSMKDLGLNGYHGYDGNTTTYNFGPYIKDGNQVGFSLTLNQTKDGNKKSFVMGFTYPEARLLREYLLTALNKSNTHSIENSFGEKSEKDF